MIEEFKTKYPLLFRNESDMEPINLFGIECSSGWKELLDTTFKLLYSNYKHHLSSLNFWKNLEPDSHYSQEKINENMLRAEKELEEAQNALPIIVQCKSKFATLRLYCENEGEYSRGVIAMAEEMSGKICEFCGEKGSQRGTRWITTLCEKCNKNSNG